MKSLFLKLHISSILRFSQQRRYFRVATKSGENYSWSRQAVCSLLFSRIFHDFYVAEDFTFIIITTKILILVRFFHPTFTNNSEENVDTLLYLFVKNNSHFINVFVASCRQIQSLNGVENYRRFLT